MISLFTEVWEYQKMIPISIEILIAFLFITACYHAYNGLCRLPIQVWKYLYWIIFGVILSTCCYSLFIHLMIYLYYLMSEQIDLLFGRWSPFISSMSLFSSGLVTFQVGTIVKHRFVAPSPENTGCTIKLSYTVLSR